MTPTVEDYRNALSRPGEAQAIPAPFAASKQLGSLGTEATREPKHIAIDTALHALGIMISRLEDLRYELCPPEPRVDEKERCDAVTCPPSLQEILTSTPDRLGHETARIEHLIDDIKSILF